MSREHLGDEALVLGPGVRTGVALRVDNPLEVGPDRVANSVAAHALHGGPCIVVDFGTAINFDAVSAAGDFVGGAIAPGLRWRLTRSATGRAAADRRAGRARARHRHEHRHTRAVGRYNAPREHPSKSGKVDQRFGLDARIAQRSARRARASRSRTARDRPRPPAWRSSSTPASAVPPVAIRSSTSSTRSPSPIAPDRARAARCRIRARSRPRSSPRQLAGLAQRHEAEAEPGRDGGAEDEPARLDPGDAERSALAAPRRVVDRSPRSPRRGRSAW